MKNTRKRFTGIASVILVLSLILSACSGASEKSVTNEGSANEKGLGTNVSSTTAEPYELTYAVMSTGPTDDAKLVEEEISKITKEKINVTVKLEFIGGSQWTQQTNLMLSGNEKLDLIMTNAYINHYSGQVSRGQIIAIDDLLVQYGQGIQEVLEKDVIDATRIDGKLYGIPRVGGLSVAFGFLGRQDLIDQYQIDMTQVKIWSDLGSVFQAIKDNDPKIIPVTKGAMTPAIATISDKFDVFGDSLGVMDIRNNKLEVINLFETEDYRDAIALVHGWYKAGYIQKDLATSQIEGNSVVEAGQAFGSFGTIFPGVEAATTEQYGYPSIVIQLSQPISFTNNASGFMTSIAKNSKNPEKAMEFLNLLYTDKEIMNLLALGIEGKHYVKKEGDTIVPAEGPPTYMFNNWQQGNNAMVYPTEGSDPEIWAKIKEFDSLAVKPSTFGFTFDPTPVKTEIAAATNVLNSYRAGLENGVVDPSKLNEFNSKLKTAGLDKIIAEKQKQLDAWAATK
ncbi:hypothetical protein BK133_01240 [Paenibacillus sp. FSL H8-0548]|uniref:ABC transporter substrate-binding protein n=1 Tax=Paenibacillus sp. FSL H8-0548 TaxID=1920422 RepID=UPI00096F347D|nr:ABC transporter substrate-binding protein [Paenibacillus sp. FSL H8-0548]OMF38853.1 hypothetical protein BK133_01240 [Paenibacillus sp. FSL H8-0548]